MPRPETVGAPRPPEFKPKYDYAGDPIIAALSKKISDANEHPTYDPYNGHVDPEGKPIWFLKRVKTAERARLEHDVDNRKNPDDLGFQRHVDLGYGGSRSYLVQFDGLQWHATDIGHKKEDQATITGPSAEDVLWHFQKQHMFFRQTK